MSAKIVAWPLDRAEPESVGLCPERLGRIGEIMRRYVDGGIIAGVITLVARRGKIAHLERFGLMDIERNAPMSDDAIFRIYSMTKIITSAAVLMLMEQGRFLLEEPACRFLPELKDLRVAVKDAGAREEPVPLRRPITVHDLLTHVSGLSYDYVHEAQDQGLDLKAFITELCRHPIKRQPGESWMYGASTDVLGRVIEVVSGQTLDAFFQERIFEPLGMTDTGFFVPPEKAGCLAWVYEPDDGGRLRSAEDRATSRYLKRPAFLSGGGGLVSTTSDYLRFALMLLNGGEFRGERLLGRKTVELMRQDHLPPGHPALDVNNRGFGLGVSVVRSLGETRQIASVGEFGWGGAACTQTWIDPAEETVSMIMLQYRPKEKFLLMDLFKQAVYQAIL